MTGLDPIALASLFVSVVALGVASYTVARSDKNASASSLIALNEAFREAWDRFRKADTEEQRNHEFAELANLLEIACALELDHSFRGKARELLAAYVASVLVMLSGNGDARARLNMLKEDGTTFKYIAKYFRDVAKKRAKNGRDMGVKVGTVHAQN